MKAISRIQLLIFPILKTLFRDVVLALGYISSANRYAPNTNLLIPCYPSTNYMCMCMRFMRNM